MSKLKVYFIFTIILYAACFSADTKSLLIKNGLDLALNPKNFFLEINTDIENTNPILNDKRFSFQTSLFYTLFTLVNLQAKVEVINENDFFCTITPGVAGWYMLGTQIIPMGDIDASMYGYSAFVTCSKQLEDDFSYILGAQLSGGDIFFKQKNTSTTDLLTSINAVYLDYALFSGINFINKKGNAVSPVVGYFLSSKKIFSKIMVSKKVFNYGISIYPDSFLLIHLLLNISINF